MRSNVVAAISSSGSTPVGQARALSATSVLSESMTLNGSVDSPNGATTTVDFLYSTASDLSGATTVAATPSTVTTIGATVSKSLSGLSPGQTYYYAVEITNTGGTAQGQTLSTLTYPSATISSSTSVGATAATFNGTVTSAGSSSTVVFEYAADTGFTSPVQVTAAQSPVVNSSSVAVSAAVTGLSSGRTYYVRLKATNATGTATSASYSSFSTLATATTNTVTTFGLTTATLLGTVTSVADSATVTFEYGTASNLAGASTVTAAQSPLTGTSQSVSAAVTTLTTGTTYYYRVKVVSAGGTVYGSILSFIPYSAPSFGTQTGTSTAVAPSPTTTSFSNVSATTATLVRSVGSGGTFLDYVQTVGNTVAPAGNSLSGLSQGTAYAYYARVQNSSSTVALTTRVTPNGTTATVSVVYGPTLSYGTNATSGGNTSVNIGASTSEQTTAWALGTHSATTYYRITVSYYSGQTVTTTGSIALSQSTYNATSTASFTTYASRSYNSVSDGASISVTKAAGYANITSISGTLVAGGGGGYSGLTAYGSGGGGGGQYTTFSGRSSSTTLSLSRGSGGTADNYGNNTTLTDSAGTATAYGGTPGGGPTGGQGGACWTGSSYNFGYNPPSANGIGGGGGGAGGAATSVDGGAASSGYGGGGAGYYDLGFASGYGAMTSGPGAGGTGNNGSGTAGYWSVTYVGPPRN